MAKDVTDYGPLTGLIGEWEGQEGKDIAPELENGHLDTETNLYIERIEFVGIGSVKNASEQCLAVVNYKQIVTRKSDGQVFHHQVGYWMWDPETGNVMHSFAIPRGVTVLAGGKAIQQSNGIKLTVSASAADQEFTISQSSFMASKARTSKFEMELELSDSKLTYFQTTYLEIYGDHFNHTDQNTLKRCV